jgi:hypothetical protein
MRNKVIFIVVSLVLSACQKENKAEQYLGCYALEPSLKQKCVDRLAKKYISEAKRNDEQYVKSFQYEYEKLGFKEFLNGKNLPCDNIMEDILYDNKHQAYRVGCQPDHEYFLRFDYNNQLWRVVHNKK